jgi:hypothetical protein
VVARTKLANDSIMRDNLGIYENFEVVLAPSLKRGLLATAKITKGELIIPPVSPSVLHTNGKIPDNALDLSITLEMSANNGGNKKPLVMRFYIAPKSPQKFTVAKVSGAIAKDTQEFIAPFWLITCTADPTKANCRIQKYSVEIIGAQFEVPVLINTKAIKVGEQLFIHQPHGTTNKFPIFEDGTSVKRQRTA